MIAQGYHHMLRSHHKSPSVPAIGALHAATVAATEAAKWIATEFSELDRRERMRIVGTFRRQLIPPGKPGRRRSKEITAAHVDWKSGIRGLALYRKHISGFERMSRWKRLGMARALTDA